MKKILSAIGIGSLTLTLLLGLSFTSVSASHGQTPAGETPTSFEPTKTYTKFIEVIRYFESYPPQTIDYDNLGWKGTLTLVDHDDFGDVYRGVYEGNVYCTGVSPMSKQLN